VLRLIVEGCTNREIAEELFMSPKNGHASPRSPLTRRAWKRRGHCLRRPPRTPGRRLRTLRAQRGPRVTMESGPPSGSPRYIEPGRGWGATARGRISVTITARPPSMVVTGQTGSVGDLATFRLDGHVATITYNRPAALNAINAQMRRDLNAAFLRFRDDEDAWLAIVTGAGRAFCVGADLRDGAGATGEFAGTFWEKPTLNSFESGWEIFKPVIAAVNGYCLGYGLTFATWCDFVLASDRAEFGLPELRLGVPAVVASIRLPQRINWADAMELLLTGERIDAARAQAIGLVWKVVPHETLLEEAQALATRLLSGAPLAQRVMKEMAMRTRHMATLEAIRFGETMRQVAGRTQDAVEGLEASVENRLPRWTGR
jgi:E-phenylitaconyl-CoA hydratase